MLDQIEICEQKRNRILFIIYLIYIIIMTQKPFEYSIFWIKNLESFGKKGFIDYIFYMSFHDIIDNLLMFLPFGIFLFCFLKKKKLSGFRRAAYPLFFGFLFSALMETGQLFLDRSATVFDVVANGTGTWMGYELGRGWHRLKETQFIKVMYGNKKGILFGGIGLYSVLLFLTLFVPPVRNHLNGWSDNYHLLIGNEEGLERPWQGDIALVALYNKRLSGQDIRNVYKQGMDFERDPDLKKGLVAFFPFCEGKGDTIFNRANDSSSVYLTGETIHWLPGGKGVRITGGEPLRSPEPAREIIAAIKETSQFSVEAWIRTDNFKQKGPARIVTLSEGTGGRNFTLAQQFDQIHLRVRTMQSGWNGSRISLRCGKAITDSRWHHVVATFDHGVERAAVDGRFLKQMVRIEDQYCPAMFGLGNGKIGGILFCLSFFFPLACLFMISANRNRIIKTGILITGFVAIVELTYFILFGQPFGWFFLFKVWFAAALGAIIVLVLNRGKPANMCPEE